MKKGAALREALDAAACAAEDEALAALLERLDGRGYAFTTPNNRTYRILRRRDGVRLAKDLRDVLGWSLPYVPGSIDPEIETLLACARQGVSELGRDRSTVRVSTVEGRLFLHSAYGAGRETVFLGPDTYRFVQFLKVELATNPFAASLLDIGTGAGVGGVIAAEITGARRVSLADVNPQALRFAALNARHAGVQAEIVHGTGLEGSATYDLVVANPPFIAGGGKTATDGGELGLDVALDWTYRALPRLRPGGRLLLYSGAPIVAGRDPLAEALLAAAHGAGCRLRYRELDPDIFSETLRQPAYAAVERIAAVGAAFTRPD